MPIAFDTTGFQQHDQSNWFNPANGDQVSLTYFDQVPDLPAPLEDPERLRHDLAVITGEVGCLIEAHVVHLGGVPALFQIVKLPIPNQPTGQAFIASFTLPKATCSAVLKVQAVESGMTGVREAVLVSQIGFDKWVVAHPYAPEMQGRLPFHVGDDPRFDPQFADHPLSRVRAWAHHIARTAQVDPRFASLPGFQQPASAVGYTLSDSVQTPPSGQPVVSGHASPAAGLAQAALPVHATDAGQASPAAGLAQVAPPAQAFPAQHAPMAQAVLPTHAEATAQASPAIDPAQAAPPMASSAHAPSPAQATDAGQAPPAAGTPQAAASPVSAQAALPSAPPPAPTDSGQPAPHTPPTDAPQPPVPAVGTTLTTVVPGIPIGGILPLWLGDDDVSYWRMTQPDLVLGRLAQGVLARFPILESRFRDIVALDADTATIMLTGRYRNDDGGVAAEMTSLVRVTAEEAYAALTTDAIKEAFDWVGRASYAAAERGEYVCVEPGGVTYREKPYVLMIVREINGQWLSLVETAPLPKDAPIWRDQQTGADTDGQMLSGPASHDAVVAGGVLALYAITTWDLHWFQLALSFGPSRK
ncbi:hypothetical protein [Lentzea tibetensis]|uniref:hypothetical protein n=1 Tax=Lentzea tibetensis TaxID=2591470 RepID=UPI0016457211|nr:hypothetical protein [Lentzea tibetensis]